MSAPNSRGPTVELEEIHSFLEQHEPFSHLPEPVLSTLVAEMVIRYVRRGDVLFDVDDINDELFIIRSGAVDVLSPEGTLVDRRGTGSTLGYSTLVGHHESNYRMEVVEDSLVLVLAREPFIQACEEHDDLARFFSTETRRTSAAVRELEEDSTELLRSPVGEMSLAPALTISSTSTIAEAAQAMTEQGRSSALVLDDDLRGIVTDRDLRARVLAAGLDPQSPVTEIMTSQPVTVAPHTMAMEVMLLMTERGFHHVPVVDGAEVLGIVSQSDIARLLHDDPIFIAADLRSKNSVEDLRGAFSQAAQVAVRYIDRGSSPQEVANIITMVADALARRLCTLAEEKLGPPPVPYAFVVVGSQGRREMGLASDQDNALVLDDAYDETQHGDYFQQLSDFVCVGLDQGGQVLCPGDMMASNPEWRMNVSQWEETFSNWVAAPQPDALLHTQVFFDLRTVAGEASLGDRVHRHAVRAAKASNRAQAHMASLAARREPPLTFFRGLVVERNGEHVNTLNIKKGGTAAIVQIARLYALAGGYTDTESDARLAEAAGDTLSKQGAAELGDAHTYLRSLTLRHQANQVRQGLDPDYQVDPRTLSRMEREHLRDAFRIIKGMQSALATKYPVRNI
ncbi:MAG: DUF294 nucleotidyltransferase-like domain-containing protein [Corynebacterium camporealensis]|uniref:DUF294 nucleotidyltransferase-like domain-containing protein n=1 Tax=Corynebacterium camporealensis TaxID=161896 RepID=UPI002A90D3BC|nr:DUF294 nucleotidyltransferase-like domain-containing protein [Corynebacterium camporealensis]MDY5839615.1 DUF294 nucleotidyltransferase-like domain-containing protein [Corynebacterium camporealensis]